MAEDFGGPFDPPVAGQDDVVLFRSPQLSAHDTAPPLEIERKYLLIIEPGLEQPALEDAERLEMETTFLYRDNDWKRRVRRISSADGERYQLTEKRRVDKMVQEEVERDISSAEYKQLLKQADPERVVVKKTRLKFAHEGRTWELDVYREPQLPTRLEVELDDAAENPQPPAFLGPLIEVSTDRRFSDRQMAKPEGATVASEAAAAIKRGFGDWEL